MKADMGDSLGNAAVETAATRRLLRATWWRPALAVCMISSAVPLAAFVTLSAFSLTREDVQERDFGRYDARLAFSTTLPPGSGSKLRDLTELEGDGGVIELVSLEMRTTADPEDPLVYRETSWTDDPYPGLSLITGRWPTAAGEVVISDTMTHRSGEFSVLSGRAEFTVVGRASSRFSDDPALYAAPGTWDRLSSEASLARQNLAADAALMLDGASVPRTLRQATAVDPGVVLQRRSEAQAETSWVIESPLAFFVPACLLPFLAGSLALTVVGARRKRFVDMAVGVGMTPMRAALVSMAPVIVMSLPSLLVGMVSGLLVGFAGRWVGALIAHQESSVPRLLGPMALVSASLLLGLLSTGFVASRRYAKQTTVQADGIDKARVPSREFAARRGAALLLTCGSVFALFQVSNGQTAMIFALGLLVTTLLLLPEAISVASKLLTTKRPDQRLARRLLSASGRGQMIGTAFTAVLLTLPLVTAVLSTATGGLQRNEALADVGERQVGLNGRGGVGEAPAKEVAAIAHETLRDHPRVQVRVAGNAWYDVFDGNALVLTVGTPADIEDGWGRPLSEAQQRTLSKGGALVWNPGAPLLVDERPVEISMAQYLPSPEWAKQSGAVLLEEHARALGIKTTVGRIVYVDVSASQAQRVREQVAAAGLDPNQVFAYHPPEPLLPPAPLVASCLLLFVALIASLVMSTRASAMELRRLLSRMITIGSSPRFARRTFMTINACTSVVAAIIAVVVTAGCIWSLRVGAPDVELNISWLAVLGGLVTTILAVWAGARIGLRRLHPQ